MARIDWVARIKASKHKAAHDKTTRLEGGLVVDKKHDFVKCRRCGIMLSVEEVPHGICSDCMQQETREMLKKYVKEE